MQSFKKSKNTSTIQKDVPALVSSSQKNGQIKTSIDLRSRAIAVVSPDPKQQGKRMTISDLHTKIVNLETKLCEIEKEQQKCTCINIDKRVNTIQKTIDWMQDPSHYKNIPQTINEQINGHMGEIHSIINSLAHVEASFSSIHSIMQEFDKMKLEFTKIQNAIKTCEALYDANISLNTQIQIQIGDINSQMNNTRNNGIGGGEKVKYPIDPPNLDAYQHRKMKINPMQAKTTNKFMHPIAKNRRFVTDINICGYAKNIEVGIDNAMIFNLDQFSIEFTNVLRKFLGEQAVDGIAVTNYKAKGKIIDEIVVAVSFKVPLPFTYLNDLKFPSNWHFFSFVNKKHHKQKQIGQVNMRNRLNAVGNMSSRVNKKSAPTNNRTHNDGHHNIQYDTRSSERRLNNQQNRTQHIYMQHTNNTHHNKIGDMAHNKEHQMNGQYIRSRQSPQHTHHS